MHTLIMRVSSYKAWVAWTEDPDNALANELPRSIDVQLELLRIAEQAKDEPRQVLGYERLVDNYLSAGMHEPAVSVLREAVGHGILGPA